MANVTKTTQQQIDHEACDVASASHESPAIPETALSVKLNKNAPEFVPRARCSRSSEEDNKDLEEIISVITSSTHSNSPPSAADPSSLTTTSWMPHSLFPANLSSFPTATATASSTTATSSTASTSFSAFGHGLPPAPTTISRAHSSPSTSTKPTQSSLSKRGFYISKEKIAEMMQRAQEPFVTDQEDDEKLAFSYYKESVAMQINDGQLRERYTKYGCIVIINIDLHFKESGECMYLIATANDADFVHKVGWQIAAFMNKDEISQIYHIDSSELPKSSRSMRALQDALCIAPENINFYRLEIGDLTKIPKKVSKRTTAEPAASSAAAPNMTVKPAISKYALRKAIQRSFRNHDTPIVPVVVIKGKRQWIEWKRFVEIRLDHSGRKEWIGVSLRYHQSNRQWKVECIDLDGGRIYYQHRLVGLAENDQNYYRYNDIMQYVTIASLHIHNNGGVNNHNHNHSHSQNHNVRTVPYASKSMSHIQYQHRGNAKSRNIVHSRNGSSYSYKRKVESQEESNVGGALELEFSDILDELNLAEVGGDALSTLFTQMPAQDNRDRGGDGQHNGHGGMARNGKHGRNAYRARKFMMEKV